MEFELNTTKLLDDNGNDLLADIGISNMMEEATAKMVQDMNNRREAIIREKLKEKIGIDINIEEEQKRRFKRLAVEYRQKKKCHLMQKVLPLDMRRAIINANDEANRREGRMTCC